MDSIHLKICLNSPVFKKIQIKAAISPISLAKLKNINNGQCQLGHKLVISWTVGRHLTKFNLCEVNLTTFFKIKIQIFSDDNSILPTHVWCPYLPWLAPHPFGVWDHNSYTQFQPRTFPRLQFGFSWHVQSTISQPFSHVAGLGGVSTFRPILWQNQHPLLYRQKVKTSTACWGPESKRKKWSRESRTIRVDVVGFGKQTAERVLWPKWTIFIGEISWLLNGSLSLIDSLL